jgi:hypothetical protein
MRSVRLLLALALVASLVLVTPLFAGPEPPLRAIASDAAGLVAPAAHPEDVLYEQMDSAGTSSYTSQNFEAGNDAYDNQGADDFVVPSGAIWTITAIDVPGVFYNGSGPMDSVNVWFYRDNAGLPGTQVYEALNVVPVDPASGTVSATLTTPAQLGPGTYWLSVQSNTDFGVGGQWGWTARTVQSNSPAAWQNPGDGFASGCTVWGVRDTCLAVSGQPDNLFRLNGTSRVPLSVELTALDSRTPAATPVAALVLVPAALAIATLVLRKRLAH